MWPLRYAGMPVIRVNVHKTISVELVHVSGDCPVAVLGPYPAVLSSDPCIRLFFRLLVVIALLSSGL